MRELVAYMVLVTLDNLWEVVGDSCLGGIVLEEGDVDPRLVLADLYEDLGDSVMSGGLRWAVRNDRSLVKRVDATTWFNLSEFSDEYHMNDVDNLPRYVFDALTGQSSPSNQFKRYESCRDAYSALCMALNKVGEV